MTTPGRVLIVKLSSLGDLVHALPATRMIKEAWGADIHWVAQTEYADFAACFDDVQRVIAFPRHRLASGFPAYLRELRRDAYDVVIDLQGLLKSAVLVGRLARSPRRVGPAFRREGTGLFYTDAPPPSQDGRHAVERSLDVVRHLGIQVSSPQFPLTLPVQSVEGPRPRVALVPCSRWPAKNWTAEKFAQVAEMLQAKTQGAMYLIGSGVDSATCGRIAAALTGWTRDLSGRTSLVEMGGWLAGMDLVISVDSGPMHVAAAAGVPVLAIFGATDPVRTGPYGKRHRVLLATGIPSGESLARAYKKAEAGNWSLAPEQVVQAALEMLDSR